MCDVSERATVWRRERRRELQQWLNEYKSKPCEDCGKTFPPYVMHLDHRDPCSKHVKVSRLVSMAASLKRMTEEVEKCDLVCANCHAERTHGRGSDAPGRVGCK